MKNHEMYALGYIYGTLAEKMPNWDQTGARTKQAAQLPMAGLAEIMQHARRQHVLSEELEAQIGKILEDVDIPENNSCITRDG